MPQYRKKNWEIPIHRVENRRITDTTFMISHAYLNLCPSGEFNCLNHVCTRDQPQPLRENMARPRIKSSVTGYNII